MEASDYVTLLVGVLAVLGTLGGVGIGAWLAHNSAEQMLQAQLTEERRRELHALLSQIAVDCRAVVESAWIEIPALGTMTFDDMLEYFGTDSGKENAERRRALNENLTRALLLVGDHNVAAGTAALAQHMLDWSEKAVGPVVAEEVRGKRDMDAVTKGLEHVVALRRALGEFELATRDLLAVELRPAKSDG